MSSLLKLITGVIGSIFLLCSCGTYYDPSDRYVVGLRWYDRGEYKNAIAYWDPLVAAEDCDAEYMTGLLYFLGRGKLQSNEKAIELWKKSAASNQQRGQWAMGDLHYQNKSFIYHKCADCGIEKDLVKALTWYKLMEKSAKYEGEKKYAAYIISKITTEMTQDQIHDSIQAAAKWMPSPKACVARSLL